MKIHPYDSVSILQISRYGNAREIGHICQSSPLSGNRCLGNFRTLPISWAIQTLCFPKKYNATSFCPAYSRPPAAATMLLASSNQIYTIILHFLRSPRDVKWLSQTAFFTALNLGTMQNSLRATINIL